MSSFEEAWADTATPTPEDGGDLLYDDAPLEPAPPVDDETPWTAAARMLDLATTTADQLVADAETQAESLVSTAQARADEILGASRNEADRVTAELERARAEQTADLDRERTSALTGLAEEKAALEEQIATLRAMEGDYREQMRHRLTEQLSLLDATLPEPPAAVAG